MKTSQYAHISDSELLEKFYADRDQKWIGILLERYTLLLLGVCMKYLKDEHEAKDCVQQLFLKVLTEVSKYRIAYFKSWLYMVAKNHCLMKLRNPEARSMKEVSENLVAEETEQKDELIQNEETYDVLEEAINSLNEEQKQCVILFYLKKNSYQEITEKTGYNPMQVKSYIQNGKRNLKILMEKRLKEMREKKR